MRTIIPLNQVISVRPCYCKNGKQFSCECVTDAPPTADDEAKLSVVRVYYAVAVGEHRWKGNGGIESCDDNAEI